jgi:DNA replication protein DnaC
MIVNSKPEVAEKKQCESHGEFDVRYITFGDKFMRTESCPGCVKERADEQAEKERQGAEYLNRMKIQDMKKKCGISPRNFDVNFDSFICETPEQTAAKQKAEQFADEVISGGSGCLIMVGNVGAGKTMLSTAIADKVINAGKRCAVIKVGELIRDIKDSWRRDSEQSESDIIDYHSKVSLLILDEVGVQYGSDTEKMMIFEIIDGRYQNVKPTVLVSNLDVEGVKQCIGERVYDRLRDDGGKVIAFTWSSMRGQK